MRYNAEIKKYNNASIELMDHLNVKVNDLYSVANQFDESYYADWTHFNEKGAKILADAVIESIERSLKFEKRKKQIKNIEIKKCIGNKPL